MPEERVNIVWSVAETVDDIVDAVVGGRPLTRLLSIIQDIGPAKVVRRLGLPAPGDIVDRAVSEIESAVRTGTIRTPPSPEELRRRLLGR